MVSNHSSRQKGLTTVVKSAEILAAVLAGSQTIRLSTLSLTPMKYRYGRAWVLKTFLTAELFQETSRATEVFCDGCEWGCLKTVIVRALPNGRKSRAFVPCDEEPDLGRIAVAPERLKRYIATVGFAARFIGRSLG